MRATRFAAALALGLVACGGGDGGGTDPGGATGDECEGVQVAVVVGGDVVGGGVHAELALTTCEGGAWTGLDASVFTVADAAGQPVPASRLHLEAVDEAGIVWALGACPGDDGLSGPLTVTVTAGEEEAPVTVDVAFVADELDAAACDPDVVVECGSHCEAGVCTATGCCEPECGGKKCGADACGGVCGVCPDETSCAPGGSCVPPWTVVPGVNSPRGLAVDDTHLYFASHGAGELYRLPLEDTNQEPLLLAASAGPTDLQLDATHLYWSAATDGAILRLPKVWEGDQPPAAEVVADGQASPKGIDVDTTHVYWANAAGKNVARAPKEGGGAVELLAEKLKGPQAVRVDATHAYWTESSGGKVVRLPLDQLGDALAIETLVTGQDKPWRLWLDDEHVYFTNYVSGGTVVRVPKAGGTIEVLAQDLNTPNDIVGDDEHVYFTAVGEPTADYKNGAVYRHPKDGLTEIVANNQSSAGFLAIGVEHLYWGWGGTGEGSFLDGNLFAAWK